MTVAIVRRATTTLLFEEPPAFIFRKENIETKLALFCRNCGPFGFGLTR
jgi:hypothetical protein